MTKELYLSMRSKLDFRFNYGIFFRHLLTDGLLLFCITLLLQQKNFTALAACIPISILMLRNLSFMHEAVHGLAHPNPKLNDFLGVLAGSFCLLPFQLWKKIHLEHHYWAGNFNRDPSLEIMKRYPQSSTLLRGLLNFSWKTRVPLTAFAQYLVFWGHSTIGLIKNYREGVLWLNMIIPLTIWSAVIWKLQGLQLSVLGGGVVIYLVLFEVINFPHHVGLYLEDSQTARRPTWQQYQVTRTSRYAPWIEKMTVLNFNFHAEHHIFPDLPWHELPKAHRLIQASEIKPATTVIHGGWLKIQRKSPFGDFLRPEVKAKNKKAA